MKEKTEKFKVEILAKHQTDVTEPRLRSCDNDLGYLESGFCYK